MEAKLKQVSKGPINIALIKYWGKEDEEQIIPLNNSISITLDTDEFYTETEAELLINEDKESKNILILNDKEEKINNRVLKIINFFRSKCNDEELSKSNLLITSKNSFPTAAGCASSASSMSCLVKVLSKIFCSDSLNNCELSHLARLGSGSACRSIFGGFVEWQKYNEEYKNSIAVQLEDEHHWSDVNILLIIVSDKRKDISSTDGMKKSKETSELLNCRLECILPKRLQEMRKVIRDKDFNKLCELTIKDSNNFHAICRDTFPPISYLNDTSNFIVKCVEKINSFYNQWICAYTFDAGPNAFILVEGKNRDKVIEYFSEIFDFNNNKIITNTDNNDLIEEGLKEIIAQLKQGRNSINANITDIKKFRIGSGVL